MAAAPRLKVFNAQGVYIAACKHAEDAAAIVALNSDGSTIRDGYTRKSIVWHEGRESQPAAESFDFVASVVAERIEARRDAHHALIARRRSVGVARGR